MTKDYPVDCDSCEVKMEHKASWVSGTGMTFSIYQCLECKSIEVYAADEPLKIEKGTCPRCGSENPLIAGPNVQGEYECPDCGLIFKESHKKRVER